MQAGRIEAEPGDTVEVLPYTIEAPIVLRTSDADVDAVYTQQLRDAIELVDIPTIARLLELVHNPLLSLTPDNFRHLILTLIKRDDLTHFQWIFENLPGLKLEGEIVKNKGYRAIHHASKHGAEAILEYLLSSGIDADQWVIPEAMEEQQTGIDETSIVAHDTDVAKKNQATYRQKQIPLDFEDAYTRPLDFAILHRQHGVLQRLLSHGASVNHTMFTTGHTPSNYAAEQGDIEALDLICKCPQFKLPSDNLKSPIHFAAENGDIRMAEMLINMGHPQTTERDSRMSPLHYAASGGYTDLCVYLLSKGARIEPEPDREYRIEVLTALHCAASSGNCEIIDLLLDHGAGLNKINRQNGWTALHYAVKGGHSDAWRLLHERGARTLQACLFTHVIQAWKASGRVGKLPPTSIDALTPPVIREYLTPLALAIKVAGDKNETQTDRNGASSVIDYLLEHIKIGDLWIELDDLSHDHEQAFHVAISTSNYDAINKIIKLNPEWLLRKDGDGHEAVHIAAINGDLKMLQCIWDTIEELRLFEEIKLRAQEQRGASLSDVDLNEFTMSYDMPLRECRQRGNTPLHLAIQHGHTEVARWLIERDQEIQSSRPDLLLGSIIQTVDGSITTSRENACSIVNSHHRNALAQACHYRQHEMIEELGLLNATGKKIAKPQALLISAFQNKDFLLFEVFLSAFANKLTKKTFNFLSARNADKNDVYHAKNLIEKHLPDLGIYVNLAAEVYHKLTNHTNLQEQTHQQASLIKKLNDHFSLGSSEPEDAIPAILWATQAYMSAVTMPQVQLATFERKVEEGEESDEETDVSAAQTKEQIAYDNLNLLIERLPMSNITLAGNIASFDNDKNDLDKKFKRLNAPFFLIYSWHYLNSRNVFGGKHKMIRELAFKRYTVILEKIITHSSDVLKHPGVHNYNILEYAISLDQADVMLMLLPKMKNKLPYCYAAKHSAITCYNALITACEEGIKQANSKGIRPLDFALVQACRLDKATTHNKTSRKNKRVTEAWHLLFRIIERGEYDLDELAHPDHKNTESLNSNYKQYTGKTILQLVIMKIHTPLIHYFVNKLIKICEPIEHGDDAERLKQIYQNDLKHYHDSAVETAINEGNTEAILALLNAGVLFTDKNSEHFLSSFWPSDVFEAYLQSNPAMPLQRSIDLLNQTSTPIENQSQLIAYYSSKCDSESSIIEFQTELLKEMLDNKQQSIFINTGNAWHQKLKYSFRINDLNAIQYALQHACLPMAHAMLAFGFTFNERTVYQDILIGIRDYPKSIDLQSLIQWISTLREQQAIQIENESYDIFNRISETDMTARVGDSSDDDSSDDDSDDTDDSDDSDLTVPGVDADSSVCADETDYTTILTRLSHPKHETDALYYIDLINRIIGERMASFRPFATEVIDGAKYERSLIDLITKALPRSLSLQEQLLKEDINDQHNPQYGSIALIDWLEKQCSTKGVKRSFATRLAAAISHRAEGLIHKIEKEYMRLHTPDYIQTAIDQNYFNLMYSYHSTYSKIQMKWVTFLNSIEMSTGNATLTGMRNGHPIPAPSEYTQAIQESFKLIKQFEILSNFLIDTQTIMSHSDLYLTVIQVVNHRVVPVINSHLNDWYNKLLDEKTTEEELATHQEMVAIAFPQLSQATAMLFDTTTQQFHTQRYKDSIKFKEALNTAFHQALDITNKIQEDPFEKAARQAKEKKRQKLERQAEIERKAEAARQAEYDAIKNLPLPHGILNDINDDAIASMGTLPRLDETPYGAASQFKNGIQWFDRKDLPDRLKADSQFKDTLDAIEKVKALFQEWHHRIQPSFDTVKESTGDVSAADFNSSMKRLAKLDILDLNSAYDKLRTSFVIDFVEKLGLEFHVVHDRYELDCAKLHYVINASFQRFLYIQQQLEIKHAKEIADKTTTLLMTEATTKAAADLEAKAEIDAIKNLPLPDEKLTVINDHDIADLMGTLTPLDETPHEAAPKFYHIIEWSNTDLPAELTADKRFLYVVENVIPKLKALFGEWYSRMSPKYNKAPLAVAREQVRQIDLVNGRQYRSQESEFLEHYTQHQIGLSFDPVKVENHEVECMKLHHVINASYLRLLYIKQQLETTYAKDVAQNPTPFKTQANSTKQGAGAGAGGHSL